MPVLRLVFTVEIMLEFFAKEAILNSRQSSVFAVSKIHGRVNRVNIPRPSLSQGRVAIISLNQSGLLGSHYLC